MLTPITLNLPNYPIRLTRDKQRLLIYDELRKKQLVLTPEEWVRQHWIHHLIQAKGYPKILIQTEGGLKLNSLQKRTDLVVFNTAGTRILIAEFKAPGVRLSQAVFEQIARYNIVHKVPYLLVSNGLHHYYCHIDHKNESYAFLEDLPAYSQIQNI